MTNTSAPTLLLESHAGSATLDVVVPFTTPALTRAALTVTGRLTAGLHPMVRMVRTQVVPFPLQLDSTPVSAASLRRQTIGLAREFQANLEICFAREPAKRWSISCREIRSLSSPRSAACGERASSVSQHG